MTSFLDLKSTFDERSIFPKYILDYEMKQRQVFDLSTQQQHPNTNNTAPVANGINTIGQTNVRAAPEHVSKSK
jgi:hypothetical protein